MAPVRPWTNASSLAAEDCVAVGNVSGAITNSTCSMGPVYDHVGAMKFVVTTILVYALLGTVTLLFLRIRRRASNTHKAMDVHDEHVEHYLREGGRLKAEGNRMKLRSEIRKFYSNVPQQEQHETHYQKKPWLRDLVAKPKTFDPKHDTLTLHVQHPQRVLRSHSDPCPARQQILRDYSGLGVHEEHELQPLRGQAESDCPVTHDLHVQPFVSPGVMLDLPLSDTYRIHTVNDAPSHVACGSDSNGSPSAKSPFSDLQVHQSAKRKNPVDSLHPDTCRHVAFSNSSPGSDSHSFPDEGETGSTNASQNTEARRESLVSFDGRDVLITSLSQDDVSAGPGRDEEPGTEVVFLTDASMEPKKYEETAI